MGIADRFTTEDRCIVERGKKLIQCSIVHDEDKRRAIEPVQADELIRRIAYLLNMFGSKRCTGKHHFAVDVTGLIDVCTECGESRA